MKSLESLYPKLLALLFVLVFWTTSSADLFQYLQRDTGASSWEIVRDLKLKDGTREVLIDLHSQTWQGIPWKHKLRVLVPKNLAKPEMKTLLIVGGSFTGGNQNDEKAQQYGLQVAEIVKAPVAMLYDTPNQPLYDGLKEDRLLAETFDRYYKTGDESWPIIFPMVKGVVKAMDSLTEFLAKEANVTCDKFVVTGPSKRGWTTWFMPIADARVVGIAPMVYDNLDIERQMQHQLDSWGQYSAQISAYTDKNLPQKLKEKDPKTMALVKIIDPFVYRDKLNIPKLMVNGTNDRFWTLDALNVYYDALPSPKYIYYAPNAEHNLQEGRDNTISTIAAFFKFVDGQMEFPEVSATFTEDAGRVGVNFKAEGKPWEVVLMRTSANTRDFRDSRWEEVLMNKKRTSYELSLKIPENTYTALFCQAVYFEDGNEFTRSSQIHIVKPLSLGELVPSSNP
jgi:PhoPQ-activated pathogenicity-related protein